MHPTTLHELAELHGDVLLAARALRLCQVVAGQRLLELRDAMPRAQWDRWVRTECPISDRRVLAAYLDAAAAFERDARDAAAGQCLDQLRGTK